MKYEEFLARKAPRAEMRGIEPGPMPSHLFGFQKACIEFNLRCGSGGLFLDTGLGKTPCELEWARQASEATNAPALIMTPLAVARQMQKEGLRWGYDAHVIRDQSEVKAGINICNYDRLDKLDPQAFGAVALDESSILKNFAGKTSRALIDAFAGHRFRLSATATPAPNDHMELGQHSEFCGIMNSIEMLSQFFINDTSTASQQWRLKRHGVDAFWDWMASWARMLMLPSDLGFSDDGYILPPLNVKSIRTTDNANIVGGDLFGDVSISATGMHNVKRQTAEARAKAVAGLVMDEASEPWVIWCDTDYEADAILQMLDGAQKVVEVRGSHPVDRKEDSIAAFLDGSARVLITKPSVCGWGLNLQHCARTAFVGRSFSYEGWYQAVRRFWRFGQKRPVECTVIVAQGEDDIGRVIDRKADDHARMKKAMALAMKRATERSSSRMVAYHAKHTTGVPEWIRQSAA